MTRQIYFLHIPKTAGTSFRRILEQHFPPEAFAPVSTLAELSEVVRRDPAELSKYPIIAGHLGYHAVNCLAQYPRVITMLREPVARTVSTFNYITREKAHWVHKLTDRFNGPTVDLEAFLDHTLTRNLLTNFQTRYIALNCDIHSGFIDNSGGTVYPGMGRLLAEFAVNDRFDRRLLDTAKARLKRFDFVGITERFPDSMFLLAKQLGWMIDESIPVSNTDPERVLTTNTLSAATHRRIEDCVALDIELYKFACDLFEQRFRSACTAP